MSDSRPRPQFGEYATPEQQRAARGLPEREFAPPPPPAPVVAPAATKKPRMGDRIVTIALLAYGLVTVISAGISNLNLGPVMSEAMAVAGIPGEFSNFAGARTWGMIATVVLVTGWVLTALLSVFRLRRGALTWWLPLVGGIVVNLLAAICMMVALMSDPAVTAFFTRAAGG